MKGTVAPPSASSSTARAPARRTSGWRAANHGSNWRGAGGVKTGALGRLGDPYAATGGGSGAKARRLGEAPPEVPRGHGAPGAPALGGAAHPVRLGESALPVGELHGLAHPVVVHGQDVGAAE